MAKEKNYYEVLDVDVYATQDEIKQAYFKKIKIYHPDTYNGNKQQAEQITASLNLAYDTLGDEQKRQQYNSKLGIKPKAAKPENNQKTKTNKSAQGNKNNNSNKQGYKSQQSAKAEPKNQQGTKQSNNKKSAENEKNFDKNNKKTKKSGKNFNIFGKKPKEELTDEQKRNLRERRIFDIVIITLLILVVVLLIFNN